MIFSIPKTAISLLLIASLSACGGDSTNVTTDTGDTDTTDTTDTDSLGASVTQGVATTTITNLFAQGGRVAGVGEIIATDGTTWVVPADTNFTNDAIPFAPDLYNDYGDQYASAAEAVAAIDDADITTIDAAGELFTAYLFADNYFELHINGIPVAKDAVPFTLFNSHVVQFRVERPFTIAMQLVDWEENLGLGSEGGPSGAYTPGDGGVVAVFTDSSGATVASTGSEWKAQTYYISPVKDQNCVLLNGNVRDSSACDSSASTDGSADFAYHWAIDSDWTTEGYDDSGWPAANTYTNATVGIDNKPGYTNYTDIFDDATNDAEFIWSSNLILDNSVLVRYTVE